MKHDQPQFKLRLPAAIKEQLDQAAAANDRTLTAEIVARLAASLEPVPAASPSEVQQQLIRMVGFSLRQLSDPSPSDSKDAALLRDSLRSMSTLLWNGDLKAAMVEASHLAYTRSAQQGKAKPPKE